MNEPKRIAAQQREMPEPSEGYRKVPWLVVLIVGALFAWSIGYIAFTHQGEQPSYGDRRSAADFAVAAPAPGGVVDGAQLYTAQCLACHQASGQGLPGVFPPIADSEWVNGKASLAIQIVLHGVTGEMTVGGTTYNSQMPTFKDKMNDAEVAAVVSYIRTNFGNTSEPVDAETVKAERAATADRTEPWNGDADLQAMK